MSAWLNYPRPLSEQSETDLLVKVRKLGGRLANVTAGSEVLAVVKLLNEVEQELRRRGAG